MSGNPLVNIGLIQASNGGSLTVNGSWTNASGATIGISGGGTLVLTGPWTNNGTIQADNSQVQLYGNFTAASLGTFNVTGTASVVVYGVLDNSGHTFDLSTFPGWDFMHGGTIQGGTIGGGTLVIPASGYIYLDGVTLATDMTLETGSQVYAYNNLTLSGSTIRLRDAYLYFYSALLGSGTVRLEGGSPDSNFMYGTDLTLPSGITVRSGTNGGYLQSNTTLTVQGSIVRTSPAMRSPCTGAPTSNRGNISANPNAPINVNSDYQQTSAGRTNIAIAGTSQTQYGRVIINGAAALAGTLSLSLANGFTPTLGQTFDIVTFASRTGTFGTVLGTSLGGGLAFQVSYNATRVRITVVTAP